MVEYRKNRRVATGMAIGLVIASAGCDSSSTVPVTTPIDTPEPEAITEREVAGRGGFYADAEKTVFLSLESAGGADDSAGADTGGSGWDVIPFDLPTPQTIDLCMAAGTDENDSVEIDEGVSVVASNSGECNSVDLQAGSYTLKVTRDPSVKGRPPVPMFVSGKPLDTQCPTDIDPLKNPDSLWLVTTIGGWLKGRLDESDIPGRVAIVPTLFAVREGFAAGTGPYSPDQGVRFSTVRTTFKNFTTAVQMMGADRTLMAPNPGDGYLSYIANSRNGLQTLTPVKGTDWAFTVSALVQDTSMKQYAWGIQYPWVPIERKGSNTFIEADGAPTSIAPIQLNLAMRAYLTPSGTDSTPLGIGEVAITPAGSRYTFVLNDSNSFPTNISAVIPPASTYTVRTGCDASVNLYPATGYGGQPRFIGRNTVVKTNAILSAKVVRTRQILVRSNACNGCNLTGVDLSGYSMRGVNLTDVEMSGANLTNTDMDQGTLTRVNLDHAALAGASFRGASFTDVGFTGTDLRQTKFDALPNFKATASDPCSGNPTTAQSRFANSDVGWAQLPPAVWPMLDLSGARLDRTGINPSFLTHTAMCGTRLRNVSLDGLDLTGVQFDGSDLSNASFAGDTGGGGTPGSGPQFRYTTLDGTNFSNTALVSAVFDYASGRGTQFTNARLESGSMLNATMPGIAATFASFGQMNLSNSTFDDASGASTAVFDGAFFNGDTIEYVNLTNASMNFTSFIDGSFKNSTLVQTLFVGATFSAMKFNNVRAGSANFTSAVLSDVDLSNTTFVRSSTAGVSTSFATALLCGMTLNQTDFSGANLAGAIVPSEPIEVEVQSGEKWTCSQPSLSGLTTSATTTCPAGRTPSNGASCNGADWVATTGVPFQCCLPSADDCARLRTGEACTSDCDCRNEVCGKAGKCL